MAANGLLLLILPFLLSLISLAAHSVSAAANAAGVNDIHDLLPEYGFPKGLLPNAVKSYTLAADGSFKIELTRPCYVQFEVLVYYGKRIKGKLSYGSVSQVSGIQARKLFLWVTVSGMDVDTDSRTIEFHVGALSQKLPIEEFVRIPDCTNKACQDSTPDAII